MPRARPQAPHFDRVCALRGRPAAQRSSSQVPLRTPYTSLDCIQGKKRGILPVFRFASALQAASSASHKARHALQPRTSV